jgi:hypothetical protein
VISMDARDVLMQVHVMFILKKAQFRSNMQMCKRRELCAHSMKGTMISESK